MAIQQVLVVDHSAQRRNQLKRLLIEREIYALEASSCEEALQILQQETLHLVLTETELPAKSGLFLLKTIKESYPEVEVVLITHNASSYNLLQALRLGAYDFIVRPIDTGEILFHAVDRVFRQVQLRQENRQLLLELEQQNRSLQRAHTMMKALNQSIERLAASSEIETLFMELLSCAMTELHAARGFLALFDRSGENLALKVSRGIPAEARRSYTRSFPPGLTLALARRGKAVAIPGAFEGTIAAKAAAWERESLFAPPGLLAAPLLRQKRVIGLVVVSGQQKDGDFGEHELDFLMQLAHHAVLAMEKVGIIHQLKRGRAAAAG